MIFRQSYDVTIELRVESTGISSSNTLDLKNPYFRYAGQPASAPPGHSTTSPSETYWAQLDVQGARQGSTVGSHVKGETMFQLVTIVIFQQSIW